MYLGKKNVSWCGSLSLFYLEQLSFFDVCFHAFKSGKIFTIISFFTYSLSSYSSSFLTPSMYMLICSTVYSKSFRLSLLTFLQSFSFCFWHLIISIVLSSNSVILSLFNSTLNPFGRILNFCYCTFQLQKSFSLVNFHFFSYTVFFPFCTFLDFSSLSILKAFVLKTLSSRSAIKSFSGTVSLGLHFLFWMSLTFPFLCMPCDFCWWWWKLDVWI